MLDFAVFSQNQTTNARILRIACKICVNFTYLPVATYLRKDIAFSKK